MFSFHPEAPSTRLQILLTTDIFLYVHTNSLMSLKQRFLKMPSKTLQNWIQSVDNILSFICKRQ